LQPDRVVVSNGTAFGCVLMKDLRKGYTRTFFFLFEEISSLCKAYFVGPDKRIKPRLSQALTRDARVIQEHATA